MVLESLGDSLKQTFRKIAGLGVVDKGAVEAIVRDLQRALLQADVDVELVVQLSGGIKKKMLEGKPPEGLTLKEYFIKTLYDDIVKFLGEEKSDVQLKKQHILLMGLFGSGKCVHPKSNIVLGNGHVVSAENLYEDYRTHGEKQIEEGTIIDLSDENLLVPSFNPLTLKMENKRVTHLWRLKGKELLDVKLDSGSDFSVKVTPEHPFFVLREGAIRQVRADELNGDDFVAIPRKYDCESRVMDLYPYLKKMDLWVYSNPEAIRKEITLKYGTIKEAARNLDFRKNYCSLTSVIKRGQVPIKLIEAAAGSSPKIRLNASAKPVFFPRYLNADLAEFLGYLAGDGHITKLYMEISNEDPEVIERVCLLSEMLFGIKPKLKRDIRTKRMYRIHIASKTLACLITRIFGFNAGRKGRNLGIPPLIMTSDKDVVRVFLRAYFDCDASLSKETRQVELTSESRRIIYQTAALLLRFNITSTISRKIVNSVPYWRLAVRARYAELYAEKIGFRIARKQGRADQYKQIGIRQGCGKLDMIPLAGRLKELRQSLGFSVADIQEHVNSYGRYEMYG
ncbi:MAG: signal recognition particle receptor subunit alpha, partial [Candidatus Aenigmarchaeota archaeon]|nr:signal recognition particle receptor subunit alpha [Candidatus Aenigmarchaeota archaeon]